MHIIHSCSHELFDFQRPARNWTKLPAERGKMSVFLREDHVRHKTMQIEYNSEIITCFKCHMNNWNDGLILIFDINDQWVNYTRKYRTTSISHNLLRLKHFLCSNLHKSKKNPSIKCKFHVHLHAIISIVRTLSPHYTTQTIDPEPEFAFQHTDPKCIRGESRVYRFNSKTHVRQKRTSTRDGHKRVIVRVPLIWFMRVFERKN